MAFTETNGLRYYSFEVFDDTLISQGVFTRRGGVSPAPWGSLNTGGLSGDSRDNVVENRRRIFAAFNRPVESIYDVWQVHSAEVKVAQQPRPLEQPHEKADAIITDRPEITLFMRFGDCVPILFHDPTRQVVALAHAGWQGTLGGVVGATVEKMVSRFGCQPADILAGIGPSICPEHYEVGLDVVARVQEAFGADASAVIIRQGEQTWLNLWLANEILLKQAGLHEDHIQISGVCTAGNLEDWYSHRAEHGKTGRFGALIALK